MPAPDPVAEAITRGLQAMIAADPPPEEQKAKGLTGLLKRLCRRGEAESRGR